MALNERGRPDHGLALLTFPSVLAGDLEDGLGALSKLCPRENEHAEARVAWFLDLLHHSLGQHAAPAVLNVIWKVLGALLGQSHELLPFGPGHL